MAKGFTCEFNHPLATIVGARVDGMTAAGYIAISWEGLVDHSPNETPGIQFMFRNSAPDSVPMLRHYPDAGMDKDAVVVVNEGFPRPGVDLPPGQFRPPLWIDFDRPQRAVGLEFGYVFIPDINRLRIGRSQVRLTAFDGNGNPLEKVAPDGNHIPIQSTAEPLVPSLQPQVAKGTAFNQIGVIDIDGRISSVKLEFLSDIDSPQNVSIVEQQVVSRVWHEVTVPAIAKQGCLLVDSDPQASADNNIPIPPVCDAVGPVTLTLPNRCDKAAVWMRGFKYQFLDDQPHQLYYHGAGIQDPSTFSTNPGGQITLTPFGFIDTDPTAASPHYRVLVYYTLLAWDSTQVDLFSTAGFLSDHVMHENLINWIDLSDPCPQAMTPSGVPDSTDTCGPLFGGLQWFLFGTSKPQEISEIDLTMGTEAEPSGLHRVMPGAIKFGVAPTLKVKDGQGYDFGVGGIVLTGRSLHLGPDHLSKPAADFTDAWFGAIELVSGPEPPRPSFDSWTLGWSDVRGIHAAWPVWDHHDDQANRDLAADMAFLAVRHWEFGPDGPVRELEVEFRGERYDDSCALDWQLALGISSKPKGHDENRFAFALPPTFGAVMRNTNFIKAQLLIQGLGFVGFVGGSVPPHEIGAVSNQGDAACSIISVERGGPDDQLFQYVF
jgi:hypothetical protein